MECKNNTEDFKRTRSEDYDKADTRDEERTVEEGEKKEENNQKN